MKALYVLAIVALAAFACVALYSGVNLTTGGSRTPVPAAPGVVPALGTPVLTTPLPAVLPTFPVTPSEPLPHSVPAGATLPAITAPGADAPGATPVPVPTSVLPQMPTTGEWGLPFDLRRDLPVIPAAAPAAQAADAIARLVIPRLGVDSPVVPAQAQIGLAMDGSLRLIWTIPNYAAGWHTDSVLPGSAGNSVISGHNNVGSQVFRQLEEMQIGDAIYVQMPSGTTYLYTVQQVLVLPEDGQPESVRIANARYLLPTSDTRLTLVSCWPDWTNTERVVVVALP